MTIIRKVGKLGRVVLPLELRKQLEVAEGDVLDISTDGKRIIMEKHNPACYFCKSEDKIQIFKDNYICKACMMEIVRQALTDQK